MGAGIILFPLFYLFELFAFSWLLPGFWMKFAFLVSLPLTGKLAFIWYILLRKNLGRYRILQLKWFKTETYRRELNKKEQLFERLNEFISTD